MTPREVLVGLVFVALTPVHAFGNSIESEIKYLLSAIGRRNCALIRNGSAHSAGNAQAHLRMKYGKAKRWMEKADDFIERLASKSYLSGHPYSMRCPSGKSWPTGDWLYEKLAEYRESSEETNERDVP